MPVERFYPAESQQGSSPPTPTPTTPATITAAELATALGITDALAARYLAVSASLVTRYCPTCPTAVANEAIIRASGWLHSQPKTGAVSEAQGDVKTDFLFEAHGCLRHSGAMSLLSSFKERHAGKV